MPKVTFQPLGHLFTKAPFFLQGQMDVNQRSVGITITSWSDIAATFFSNETIRREIVDLESWDSVRRDMLILLLRSTNERKVPGEMDADLYNPVLAGLRLFCDRMSPGGAIAIHDYHAWPGARDAVDDCFRNRPEVSVPPDKSGSAVVIRNR